MINLKLSILSDLSEYLLETMTAAAPQSSAVAAVR